jgi:DNA-binding MarR family transcriptional regulator
MEELTMALATVEHRIDILRHTMIGLVRRNGPDQSARQLGVFLTCYLEEEAQTVRGLAAKLNVSKPAITRALDRLSEFWCVERPTHSTGAASWFSAQWSAPGSCAISRK